jgi:Gpi18-like mannosyltransferase
VAYIGILISNACHLLSALVLARLAKSLAPPPFKEEISFISAALHILSPAGLFLTAPYAESLFSLLSFLGYLFYVFSCERPDTSRDYRNDARLLASGVCFGLATTVRSNGVLAGLIFVFDVLADVALLVHRYPHVRRYGTYAISLSVLFLSIAWATGLRLQELLGWVLEYWRIFAIAFANAALYLVLRPGFGSYNTKSLNGHIRKIIISIFSGAYIAGGLIFPQYLAYKEYCTNEDVGKIREWCSAFPPSVYSWVQSHYW